MKFEESKSQQAVIKWWSLACRQYGFPSQVLFAIPNGGSRSKFTGAILKREGMIPGVPDLFMAIPRKLWSGLFIEMKHGSNKPSEKQVEMIKILSDRGYEVSTCYSSSEEIKTIEKYLK